MAATVNGGAADASQHSTTDLAALKAAIEELAARREDGEIDDADTELAFHEIAKRYNVPVTLVRQTYKKVIAKFVARPPRAANQQADEAAPEDPTAIAAAREAAFAQCSEIASDPRLIERLFDVTSRLGVAGDRRGVLATFLVAISRLLLEPNRMLRKGSAASGKSHVIDKILSLLNRDDYVTLTSASAKAIFYSDIDFRHKLVVIPEAAALVPPKSGPDEFAMAIRELISSGRLTYHTVQPTGENGALVGVEIPKEGPIALLMTTARENVEEELATRLLVTLTDESDTQQGSFSPPPRARLPARGRRPFWMKNLRGGARSKPGFGMGRAMLSSRSPRLSSSIPTGARCASDGTFQPC